MAYQSVNPYDGRLLHTFAEQSDEQLEAALAAAAACFEVWRATTFAERSAIVARARPAFCATAGTSSPGRSRWRWAS